MATCKDDCEALMSEVLPVAEQMLIEHRALQPFGSTMSTSGQVVHVGGFNAERIASDAELVAEYETSFRDGAARGEIKASALVLVKAETAQSSVEIRLDHFENYSLVVTFPYRFTVSGELVIDEPFASIGAHRIFVFRPAERGLRKE
jgi:hypothetical protein